jgi:adenosylhomocysteinase
MTVKVHEVPIEIEEEIAAVKLAAMSIKIDTLTAEQRKYLASWESGT